MIKGGKRNDFDIRSRISAKTANTVIAITITYISMKKNRRTKNIGIPTYILKGRDVTTIDDHQTIVKDSMGLSQMDTIDNIGTNVVMARVRKMIGITSHTENTVNHPGITGAFNKTGKSKPYLRRRLTIGSGER